LQAEVGVDILLPYNVTYAADYVTEFVTVNPNGTTTRTVTNSGASESFESHMSSVAGGICEEYDLLFATWQSMGADPVSLLYGDKS
jgi:hypothetical protein